MRSLLLGVVALLGIVATGCHLEFVELDPDAGDAEADAVGSTGAAIELAPASWTGATGEGAEGETDGTP